MGAVAMLKDFGLEMTLEVQTDSSAAKGIASRRGVGRVRHLHTGLLWVQQRVQSGEIKIVKIKGTENAADLGTKFHQGLVEVPGLGAR